MEKVKLKEILEVRRGTSLSGKYYSKDGELIRLTLGNFNYPGYGFKENTSKEDTYFNGEVKQQYILKKGDIITPLTEQVSGLLGETATIPENNKYIQSGDIGLVIPKEEKLDKRFAYYLISSSMIKKQLDVSSQQTKIRHTSPDKIKDCIAWIPEKSRQVKIAKILDEINDAIDKNSQINNNLEEFAFTIFLHDFSNKAPNGKIGDIIIEKPKSNIKVGEAKEIKGSYPFFTSGDSIFEWNDYAVDGRNLFLNTGGNADVKFYVGKAMYSTDTWCISTDYNLSDYLYLYFKSIKNELDRKFFHGSGLKHLQKQLLKQEKLYIPSDEELKEFNKQVQAMFDTIAKNKIENNKLTDLKNFLLPLLMNGQINVDDIEI